MRSDSLVLTLQLLATLIFISLNALYVFHEFAFVALRPDQIRRLEQEQSSISRLVTKIVRELDHYIAVDQLGITISSIAVGWIGQPAVARLLELALGPASVPASLSPLLAASIAFAMITASQMIAGELMPKSIALRYSERIARLVALPVEITAWFLYPFVVVLNGIGRALVRWLGFTPVDEGHGRVLRAEDLVTVAEFSANVGTLEADPATLRRLLNFSDLRATDLIVPRPAVVALSASDSIEEVIETARRTGHKRFPVYESSLDDVVGLVNTDDLIVLGPDGEPEVTANWRRSVRSIPAVPESASVERVMRELRQAGEEIVLVLDDFGGLEGIIAVADIVRAMVGYGSRREEAHWMRRESDGTVVVDGLTSISDLHWGAGVEIDEIQLGSVKTVNGLVMLRLGRIAQIGDEIVIDGHRLVVEEMTRYRVARARVFTSKP